MPRQLGDAFINVSPDTAGFRASLVAKLKAALTGVNGDVNIGADTARLNTAIAAARAKLATLRAATSELRLDADSKALTAKIAGLQAQMAKLAESMRTMDAEVDIRAASTKILALAAEIKDLQSDANSIKIEANTRHLMAQLAEAEGELGVLTKARDIQLNAKVDIDTGGTLAKIAALRAAMDSAFKDANEVGLHSFGWVGRILSASINGVKLWHVAVSAVLEGLTAAVSATAAAAVGLAAMAPAAIDVADQMKNIRTVNETMGQQIPSLSRNFSQLSASLAPQVIEAFGGAVGLVARNNDALGRTAHQVTGMVDDLVAKLDLWSKSQLGIGTILQHGVNFLSQFGDIIGHLGDSILNLLKASPGTAHFLLDLIDGFTKILDWVSKLPTPLLTAALALHAVFTWGGFLLGVMGKIPGVFGFAARAVTAGLGAIGAALGGLSASGALAVLAAVAYIAYKIYQDWTSTSPGVTKAINSVNSALNNLAASRAFFSIPGLIGSMNDQLQTADLRLSSSLKNFDLTGAAVQQTGKAFRSLGGDISGVFHGSFNSELKSLVNVGKDMWNALVGGPAASDAQSNIQHEKNDIAALKSEIDKLLGSQRNMDREIGTLVRSSSTFGSGGQRVIQALTLMNLAGVKATDSFALMNQKVTNLIKGYQSMSVQGPILNNSVNALSFATGLQATKVNDLNSAWDTFIATVTGSETGFANVETNISGLFSAAASAGSHFTDTNGKVSSSFGQLAASASGTQGSFTGLNATSFALQQTFNQTLTSANSMLDALQTQAAAAGLGKKGTDLLTTATKDLVIQMLPAAKGSKTLTAELYALAQRGGYTGADSFKALSSWAGKTKDPMKSLQGVVETFTVKSAGLTKDVQKLSDALGTTLTGAMAQAVFLASGGQKAFTAFASAILSSKGNMTSAVPSATKLISQLLAMTHNVKEAHTQFIAFAEGALHLTRTQAEDLWNAAESKLSPALDASAKKAADAKVRFTEFAVNGLHISATKAVELWDKIKDQKLDFAGSKANSSRSQFIKWAKQLGISKQQAANLWAELSRQNMDSWLNGKIGTNQKAFFNWTHQAGVSHDKARDLWAMLAQQKFDFLSGRADTNRQHFEKLAGQFGINKKQADILWSTLRHQELENTRKHADNATAAMDKLHGRFGDLSPFLKFNKYLGNNVGHALSAVGGGLTGVLDIYNNAAKTLGVAAVKTANNAAGAILQLFRGFAAGGQVPGGFMPGRDIIPAMLSPGEFVLNPRAAKAVGYGTLDAINSGIPTFAAGGLVRSGFATHPPGDAGARFATGGAVDGRAIESSMLNFMMSQRGHPYSQTLGRFGPEYWDCSGLIYGAATRAGVPLPKSQAVASLEADWFASWDGDYAFRGNVQRGDLLFMTGSDPTASRFGGVGHTGMALDSSNMISAYDTAEGVNIDPIRDLVVAVRLGGKSAKGIPSLIPSGGAGGGGATAAQTAAYDKAEKVLKAAENWSMTGPFAPALIKAVRSEATAADAKLTAAYDAINAMSGGIPGGISAGSAMQNLLTIARYLMTNGASRAGAAGIAGTIYGESGGNPESRGSGGFGLIGWTGNTIGLPAGYRPNGDASRDLAIQMAGIIGFARARPGGWPDGFRTITDPVAAGNLWSRYEAPKNALSDTRPGVAAQVYASLGGAGLGVSSVGPAIAGALGAVHFASGGPVFSSSALASAQATEVHEYNAMSYAFAQALRHAKRGSWLDRHRRTVSGELSTLAGRQHTEASDFKALAGKGLTAANLGHLVSAAHSEGRVLLDYALSHEGPSWTKGLGGNLNTIATIAGRPIPPAATVLPPNVASQAGAALLSFDLGHFRPSDLGTKPAGFGKFAAGGLVADTGTVLAPGWNIRYNATGAPEPLVRPSGNTDALLVQLIQEMRRNTEATQQQGTNFGRALNGMVGRAASRGYYGGG